MARKATSELSAAVLTATSSLFGLKAGSCLHPSDHPADGWLQSGPQLSPELLAGSALCVNALLGGAWETTSYL